MLTVGQTIWMVPTQRYAGEPKFVQVVKVGRKWAEISARGYRIDKDTLVIDGAGYRSPGKCYLTKEEHDAEKKLEGAWRELRDFVDRNYARPDGVSIDNIRAALQALGFRANHKPD